VSLPLAPQSVHIYHRFVSERLKDWDAEVIRAPAYGLEDKLTTAFTNAIVEARRSISEASSVATVLTAHSLPTHVIKAGDPYQREFEAMARSIRVKLVERGFDDSGIYVAYQSQGMDGGDWLGPGLQPTMKEARSAGLEALVVAPIGFVAEHVETLFDIDVEAAEAARAMGFTEVARMPAMNVRDDFIDALEVVARPLLDAAS
jgi:ferrochelatase